MVHPAYPSSSTIRQVHAVIRLVSNPRMTARSWTDRPFNVRLLVLVAAPLVIGLVMLGLNHFNAVNMSLSHYHDMLVSVQTLSRLAPEGVHPLTDSGQVRSTLEISRGTLLVLSRTTQEVHLQSLLCDIFSQHSVEQALNTSENLYAPVAGRHLTIAVPKGIDATSNTQDVSLLVKATTDNPKCLPKSILVPSVSVTSSSVSYIPSQISSIDPMLVISTEGDTSMDRKLGDLAKASEQHLNHMTWISMPNIDLQHAGWIFSLPERAIRCWHQPIFKALVITNTRAESLKRLYKSLRTAYYLVIRLI
ncbi:MAG: hypothetical protein CYPHOPRED_001737 [Cyphobasidiales sp. Tagirdzhanova-0007]|nr:MAG: hypothetical protein CYPHOPRED_001737 [Cyphobasidiales sp. Tagirdzhanova-0007]